MSFRHAITRQIAIEALYRPTAVTALLEILRNIQFGAQVSALVAGGASAPVVEPVPFTPQVSSRATVNWSSTGFALIGITSLVLTLQQSNDGGATWNLVQQIEGSAVDDAGNPENRTSGGASEWLVTGLVPGTAYQFRVIASPVGGNYSTNVNEGSLLISEVPQ